MKKWLSGAASVVVAAFALVACGGGSGGASSGGLIEIAVETPALVARVESYQQPAGPLVLKSRLPRGSRPDPAVVRLRRLESAERAAPSAGGGPVQIGSPRDILPTSDVERTKGLLQFKPGTAGEGPTAAVSFSSPGAAGLRLGLRVVELPDDALVRGYTQGGDTAFELSGREIVAAIRRNRDAGDLSEHGRTFWTPAIDSEEVTLQIALPAGASADAVKVSVPLLSHLSVKAKELETLLAATSASCEIDVACTSDVDPQSRATARMIFVSAGSSYVCTGTLMNDVQSSGTPYFLSANHCISSQTVASTLTTYWFYRSVSCNAQTLDPEMQQLGGGATLLYASTDTDTSFMRLNGVPPRLAVFSGWSTSPPSPGQAVVALHNPRGDLQKVSRGDLLGFINCSAALGGTFSCRPSSLSASKYLSANWSQGTVESGSSGSGLFAAIGAGRYLVGQLKGGSASCLDPSGLSAYGRFDVAYMAALSRWLSPTAVRTTPLTSSAALARVPVHRFYHSPSGSHFYTALAAERDYVLATYPVYRYEGVAFYAYERQVSGSQPVYRIYNRATGRHFFTIAPNERDAVLTSQPTAVDEGVSWYAQWGTGGGTALPMYRFYNSSTGSHFYTVSEGEKDFVVKNYPVFALEGIAYSAWITQ